MKNTAQNNLSHGSEAIQENQDVTRSTMRFFGVVLGLASVGLWLVPGATLDGAEMLVRLVLSFLFMGIAIGFWGGGRTDDYQEEFQLDVDNSKLNHILRGRDGMARLAGQYRFDEMEELSLERGVLLARLSGGREVFRVAVGSRLEPDVMKSLSGMRKRPAM